MPGIAGISDRGKRLEGREPGEAAKQGHLWGEHAAIGGDRPGPGDEFSQRLALGDRFAGCHEKDKGDKGHQDDLKAQDGFIMRGLVKHDGNQSGKPCEKGPPEQIEGNPIDQVVGEPFAGAGLRVGVFEIVQQVFRPILAFGQFV